jgi:MFS family permease
MSKQLNPAGLSRTVSITPVAVPDAAQRAPNLAILALTAAVFLTYMTIGLALPVIPLYVHRTLGFGNVIVGVSVGIQFLATVLTRGYAGRVADRKGPSRSMRSGILFCAVAGGAYIVVALLPVSAVGKLLALMAARLVLGFGESQLIVGALAWAIGIAGQQRAGKVLAWTGMAMYGSLAIGAPVGLWLNGLGGFVAIGAANILLPVTAFLLIAGVAWVAPHGGSRQSLRSILGAIWRPGLGVALQGVGFAVIGSFVSLDFVARGWPDAGLALTCFGAAFVAVRALFGRLPDRLGGIPVAAASLAVEAVGQILLWLAPNAAIALLGATVTGCGCSMVFPAFGVEVVKRVPAQSRGTALGGFAAFQDVAYGGAGPIAGLVASSFGYSAVFAVGAIAAVCGLLMACVSWRENRLVERRGSGSTLPRFTGTGNRN